MKCLQTLILYIDGLSELIHMHMLFSYNCFESLEQLVADKIRDLIIENFYKNTVTVHRNNPLLAEQF